MKNNTVALVGRMLSVSKKTKRIYGMNLYTVIMEVPRMSEVCDTVMVMVPEDKMDGVRETKHGQTLMVIGKIQTHRNQTNGRVHLFVLAELAWHAEQFAEFQNDVSVRGIIASNPVVRETPKGRKVADVILRVPSEFTEGKWSFVPVVCWGAVAEKVEKLKIGNIIEIMGRYQSRPYNKKENGEIKNKMAFEISVILMRRRGMIENDL